MGISYTKPDNYTENLGSQIAQAFAQGAQVGTAMSHQRMLEEEQKQKAGQALMEMLGGANTTPEIRATAEAGGYGPQLQQYLPTKIKPQMGYAQTSPAAEPLYQFANNNEPMTFADFQSRYEKHMADPTLSTLAKASAEKAWGDMAEGAKFVGMKPTEAPTFADIKTKFGENYINKPIPRSIEQERLAEKIFTETKDTTPAEAAQIESGLKFSTKAEAEAYRKKTGGSGSDRVSVDPQKVVMQANDDLERNGYGTQFADALNGIAKKITTGAPLTDTEKNALPWYNAAHRKLKLEKERETINYYIKDLKKNPMADTDQIEKYEKMYLDLTTELLTPTYRTPVPGGEEKPKPGGESKKTFKLKDGFDPNTLPPAIKEGYLKMGKDGQKHFRNKKGYN